MGVSSGISNYDGFCSGFLENRYRCTLGQSVVDYMLFHYFLSLVLTPIPLFFWGMALGRVITSSMQLRSVNSAILTFTFAIAGGTLGYFVGALFPVLIGIVVTAIGI